MVGNAASFFMAASGAADFDTTLIGNSVWFDYSDDFIERETDTDSGGGASGAHSTTKCTMAFWFQFTHFAEANSQGLAFLGASSGGGVGPWITYSSVALEHNMYVSCNGNNAISSAAFRDNTWYHAIVSFDLSEGEGGIGSTDDKMRLYINGVQQTFASTTPITNFGATFPNKDRQMVGKGQGKFFGGYIAQFLWLDDKSIQNGSVSVTDILESFSFGTNGSQFGPIKNSTVAALATAAAGNSFCLDFADSSNYGNDISGEGNDLTVQGSMATSQQSTNTPSNVYAIMDKLKNNNADNSTITFAEGNLRVTGAGGSDGGTFSTLPLSTSGTTEFQATWNNGDGVVGICAYENLQAVATSPSRNVGNGVGAPYNAAYGYMENGSKLVVLSSGSAASAQGAAMTTNSVLTVRYNADDNEITFLKDNSAQGSAVSTVAGLTYYAFASRSNNYDITMHFEEGKFPHTIGSGNKTLSSSDLNAPSDQGIDSFNAVKYTGTGSSLSVTGTGFQPDFVWIKNRDAAGDSHSWYDVIRGVTKQIESDTTAVQSEQTGGLTTFGSDGFTVGALNQVNTNTEKFIAWQWKGQNGTTAISADSPPSLASTVSVSPANHFSIVSYTGNTTGSVQTIGHGLSGPPEMMIVKNLAQASSNWAIYHKANGATNYILFSGAGTNANANYFADTEPTTSAPFVFSVGTGTPDTNGSGQAMIAYCFRSISGVCKVGSYIGNGDTNGMYIATGFKPKFVMAKWSSGGSLSGENWITKDTTRQPLNENRTDLFPSSDGAEATGSTHGIDILADGFKMRGTGGANNVLNATYIYLAIADIAGGGTLPPMYGR